MVYYNIGEKETVRLYMRQSGAVYVYDYLKDCDMTRLDTNMGPVEGVDP